MHPFMLHRASVRSLRNRGPRRRLHRTGRDTAMADATGHDGTFDSDGDDDKGEPGPHPSPLTLTVGVAASCRLGVCPARGRDAAWR